MTFTTRTFVFAGIILFIAGSLTGLTGCRTAQESRRGLPASRTQPGSPLAHQLDSMGMIEAKLVEVIDSLSMLAEMDRDRIRALEADLAMLRSRIEGTPLPEPPEGESSRLRGSTPPPVPPERIYTAPPPATPPSPGALPPVASEASGALEKYQSVLRLYNAKEYSAALAAFVSLESDDPHSVYAGNYKYWEGECYYALKEYDRALRRFQNVIDEYPRSTKAPASEFKIAECYERLNRPGSARTAYERLLADYPNSEYRTRASARLNALTRSGDSGH